MEILLWLVPPVVVTGVAMVWVSWLGRKGRGRVDREEAARRIGLALEREVRLPSRAARVDTEGSTGVAVRRPVELQPADPQPADPQPAEPQPAEPRRLAS